MVFTIGIAVLLSLTTMSVLYYLFGFPAAWAGLAFLGLTGIGGLGQVIFKKDPGPVQMDERDCQIVLKAHYTSMLLSYLLFGALCMGIWAVYYFYRHTESISVHVLPLIYGITGIAAFFTGSLMTLILYGRKGDSK